MRSGENVGWTVNIPGVGVGGPRTGLGDRPPRARPEGEAQNTSERAEDRRTQRDDRSGAAVVPRT